MVDEFEHDLLDNGAAGGSVVGQVGGGGARRVPPVARRRGPLRAASSTSSRLRHLHATRTTSSRSGHLTRCAPSSDRCESIGSFRRSSCSSPRVSRAGELVGLRWADVDLDTGGITIRRIVSMTNGQRTESVPSPSARRTVTIGQRTVDVLDERRAEAGSISVDQPVFEKRGGGELNPESLSNTFRRLVGHADVSPITLAGLRHTHAATAVPSRRLTAGCLLSSVSDTRRSRTTQDMYGHLIPHLRDPHLEAFEQSILETQP